jgi:multicomponent Na+:H+ antiporter subunit G
VTVHVLALVLYFAGIAVVAASSVAALLLPHTLDRLHTVTPATSLGAPLIGLGIAVDQGWNLTTAQVLFICALVALTGPMVASATGRLAAQRYGAVRRESPQ